jgi:hypothetical protein
MRREPWTFERAVLTLFLALAGLSSITSCGGGPNVASATGHYLYLASSNGIYGFSIMSNNSLSPLSNTALASGAYTGVLVVSTPGGSSTPVLYAVNGGGAIATFPINGNGTLGTETNLTTTGSCPGAYSGLSATADGNWLLAVDNSTATNNIVSINLKSNNACTGLTNAYTSGNPVTLGINCTLSGGSCTVLVTLNSGTGSTSLTNPVLISWSSSTGAFSTTTQLTGLSGPPQSDVFDTATLYFYLTVPSSNVLGSLVSSPAVSTAFTSTQSFSPITSTPCLDVLSNAFYLPTTNGSVFQFSVDTSGNIQSPSQLWSLSSSPSIPTIYACAVLD